MLIPVAQILSKFFRGTVGLGHRKHLRFLGTFHGGSEQPERGEMTGWQRNDFPATGNGIRRRCRPDVEGNPLCRLHRAEQLRCESGSPAVHAASRRECGTVVGDTGRVEDGGQIDRAAGCRCNDGQDAGRSAAGRSGVMIVAWSVW